MRHLYSLAITLALLVPGLASAQAEYRTGAGAAPPIYSTPPSCPTVGIGARYRDSDESNAVYVCRAGGWVAEAGEGGGGGGSPGGSSGDVQVNSSGSFGDGGPLAAFLRANVALDTDGDGNPDTAYVSDWDGDGTLDMQDLDAVDAVLTDTGPKVIHVLAGTYAPGTSANTYGLWEITGASNLRIECAPGAVLTGPGIAAPDVSRAVLYIAGSSNIRIRGCEIDGGLAASYTSAGLTNTLRLGVEIEGGSSDVVGEGLYIHDVMKMAWYVRNASDVTLRNSRIIRTGGYGDAAASVNASIYYYTVSTSPTTDRGRVENNEVAFTGSNAICARRAAGGNMLRDLVVSGNTIRRTKAYAVNLGGTKNARVTGNQFVAVAGALSVDQTAGDPTAYAPADDRANVGILFAENHVAGTVGAPAVALREYQANTTIRDNTFSGLGGNAVYWENPQRHLVIDGVVATVGENGITAIVEIGASGAKPDEAVTLRNVRISALDSDSTEHPLYLGSMTEASAASLTCNQDLEGYWLTTTNASSTTDVTFASGTGAFLNRATCTSSAWVDRVTAATNAGNTFGINIVGGKRMVIDGVWIAGTSAEGIRVSGTDVSGSRISNLFLDGQHWGFLGELTEAQANALNCGSTSDLWGRWAIITNASSASDCDTSGTTGATANRCYCEPGASVDVWTDNTQNSRSALLFDAALTGSGPTISNVECIDWGITGDCIRFTTASTAANGSISNVIASHSATAEASGNKAEYAVNFAEPASGWAGWSVENVRSLNLQNVTPIDNGSTANAIGVVSALSYAGAPAAELCDNATEVGSTHRRTDGGATDTFSICVNTSAPAWDTPTY